jgi:cellobiose phosphorylase
MLTTLAMVPIGDAKAFILAQCQANAIALRRLVPSVTLRQANCYYSSSDAPFVDRYEAMADYEKVKTGAVAPEGGWGIYSSGASIALSLMHQCFLVLRRGKSSILSSRKP